MRIHYTSACQTITRDSREIINIFSPNRTGDRARIFVMDKVCLSDPAPSSSLAVEDPYDSIEIVQVPYLQETARSSIYLANME
jgi:hypothetical protein